MKNKINKIFQKIYDLRQLHKTETKNQKKKIINKIKLRKNCR